MIMAKERTMNREFVSCKHGGRSLGLFLESMLHPGCTLWLSLKHALVHVSVCRFSGKLINSVVDGLFH